jgi:hypothetical protein
MSDFTLVLPVRPERFGLFLVKIRVQGDFTGYDLRSTASNPAFSILCFAGAGDGPIEWLLEPPFENPLLRRKPTY